MNEKYLGAALWAACGGRIKAINPRAYNNAYIALRIICRPLMTVLVLAGALPTNGRVWQNVMEEFNEKLFHGGRKGREDFIKEMDDNLEEMLNHVFHEA